MSSIKINDSLQIFNHAIQAVEPCLIIHNRIKHVDHFLRITNINNQKYQYDLRNYRRVLVVGAGKASGHMAMALEEVMGERIDSGYIITKYGHKTALRKITCAEAGHPIPDMNGMMHTQGIVNLLNDCTNQDLVICLVSGGASSLLIYPEEGISLKDVQDCTEILLGSGANIKEINTIRKVLSRIKGGGLAEMAYPATVVSLIISDVIGDSVSDIGSGPTVHEDSIIDDVMQIINKYQLDNRLPDPIQEVFHKKQSISSNERIDRIFNRVKNMIIANNRDCLDAAKHAAQKLGYNTYILTSELSGSVNPAARMFVKLAKSVVDQQKPIEPPACIISGGETTVNVKGKGLGGRNQELALLFLSEISSNMSDFLFLSCGTDGTDGPTDAAGAYVTQETNQIVNDKGIVLQEYLLNNDSYHFFEKVGGLVKTGPTQTNVMDIQILLVG